jgi:hypothetical protein
MLHMHVTAPSRDTLALRAPQALVAALFAAGLVFAGLSLTGKPQPEIIIETCSFAAALLLVAFEHQRARRTKRAAALTHIAREMQRNAEALFAEQWLLQVDVIEEQVVDVMRGLRFYYPHLATVATGGALLGDALDHRKDAELICQLQLWQEAAESFNTRVTMAELLLFFLPRTTESMLERLEVHATIATETVSRQRDELQSVVDIIIKLQFDRHLAEHLAEPLERMRVVLSQRLAADAAAEALSEYLARRVEAR